MDYQAHVQMSTTDLFGCVSPWLLLQEVNDCTGYEFEADGVGIVRMINELGATWMMGQMVMENFEPIQPSSYKSLLKQSKRPLLTNPDITIHSTCQQTLKRIRSENSLSQAHPY